MKILLCVLMLAGLGTVAAKADTVTITFDHVSQSGSAGDTLQFFGTITNNTGSTVNLNGDGLNLAGLSFTNGDLFFVTVPFTLAPSGQAGASSGDIELFDITVRNPLLDAPGTFLGSYTLLGGSDENAQDILGSQGFSVTTNAGSTAVPEPASIYLLLGGVPAALAPIARRMRAGSKR